MLPSAGDPMPWRGRHVVQGSSHEARNVRTLHGSNSAVSLIHLQEAALPAPLFRRLRSGVRALGGEGLRNTYETTFWFDLGRPSSIVEEAIEALHSLLPRRSVAGVEWWLSRMRTTRVRVDFHQDRDEKLASSRGILQHPLYSSLLFLNRVRGGALAVTRQPPDRRNPCYVPMPLEADLVAPRANRLVWFDGRLTHGVLDAQNQIPGRRSSGAGELRLSVVMNWWMRRPSAVPSFSERGVYAALRADPSASRGRRRQLLQS